MSDENLGKEPPTENVVERLSFPVICEHYRDYLRLIVRLQMTSTLRTKLDESDLVQDALLRAQQAWSGFHYRSNAELLAWLRQILVNSLRDAMRRYQTDARGLHLEVDLGRSLDASSTRIEQWLSDRNPSPNSILSRHEEVLALARSLRRLPEDQRTAVELKYLRGETVAQVAQQMNRTRAGVAGLLRRGMQKLRVLMEGDV